MALKLGNLPLATIRKLLIFQGCKSIGTKGGHEKWSRSDLLRPIILQTHIDPVPEFIVHQILRTLQINRSQLQSILSKL